MRDRGSTSKGSVNKGGCSIKVEAGLPVEMIRELITLKRSAGLNRRRARPRRWRWAYTCPEGV